MKVTVEGDIDQIRDGCMTVARAIKAKPKSQTAEYLRGIRFKERERMKQNREQRQIIKRAFDLIRYNPEQKELVNNLAKALGGSGDVTTELLAAAHQIIDASGETTP